MKKSIRVLALILSMALCLALIASCNKTDSPGNTPDAAASPDVADSPGSAAVTAVTDPLAPPPAGAKFADQIIFGTDHTPISSLDPGSPAGNTPPTLWSYRMYLDSLVFQKDGVLYPCLAKSWSTDDYQTYTFVLRDDVYWHNGDKFTAKDVEYTIERSRVSMGSMAIDHWRPVEKVNIINDYEIEMVLDSVNVDFITNTTYSSAGILNERAIAEDPENGPHIGTGAYKVTEFIPNNYVTMERNDDYWGDAPYTKTVTIRFVPDVAARTIMMQNEELHGSLGGLSPDDISIFQNSDRYNVYEVLFNNPNTLGFSMIHPITGDYNFRMAVMHALDREEIALVAAAEWGVPETTGTLWGESLQFRNNDIPIVEFDLDKAKEYLDKSVYNGETLEIATAAETFIKAAQAVQQQLERIGIKVEVNQMDMPGLMGFGRYGNEETEMILTVTGFVALTSFRSIYFAGGATNRQSYDNPEIVALYDDAIATPDDQQREAKFKAIQAIIAEDPPVVNLFWHNNCMVLVNSIGGLYLPKDVWYDLRYAYRLVD